jgi:hypothetical protein
MWRVPVYRHVCRRAQAVRCMGRFRLRPVLGIYCMPSAHVRVAIAQPWAAVNVQRSMHGVAMDARLRA